MGIDGHLELRKLPGQEVTDGVSDVALAQVFASRLVGAKSAIVADVFVAAAETEAVLAAGPVHVLINFGEVLRSSKWRLNTAFDWDTNAGLKVWMTENRMFWSKSYAPVLKPA